MKAGIMLRHFDQHEGGVKIYTQNLVKELLAVDHINQYVLFYQNPNLIGTFGNVPNVKEVAIPVSNKFLWDQIAVPWAARKEQIDILFNVKFSIPLLPTVKKISIMHGSEWFRIPDSFLWYDRIYTRLFVPRYCQAADAIITVSQVVKEDIIQFTGVPESKVFAIHNGYDRSRFKVIPDRQRLEAVKQKYNLPDKFILWVGQIYPPKNLCRLIEAFFRINKNIPHDLVIVGEERWKAESQLQILANEPSKDRVRFTGWVSQEELPCLYNLADLFAFPSLYEGFGIPLLEAMACGCPVLTSNTGSPPEVVGDAALLVDPVNIDAIAAGMCQILSNSKLRSEFIQKGLSRVEQFGWERCARETLILLEQVASSVHHRASPVHLHLNP